MCGVALVIEDRPDRALSCTAAVQGMLDRMRHRGPDGAGCIGVELGSRSIAMGSVRLAITGGSEVPSPFESSGSAPEPILETFGPVLRNQTPRSLVVAFNGEIYNWQDLRKELGGTWKTDCDVEVLARGWEAWGPLLPRKLRGMFAFIILDRSARIVCAARDRAGEKPLYFAAHGSRIAMSSTVDAMESCIPLRESDGYRVAWDALEIEGPDRPAFHGVREVAPGSVLVWHADAHPQVQVGTYWSCPSPDSETSSPTDWVTGCMHAAGPLTQAIQDSVSVVARTSKPLALLLSGGLDSSLIRTLLRDQGIPVRCYTATVDAREIGLARLVDPDTVPVPIPREESLQVLPELARHLDTPATWTALAQWFLMRKIREDLGVGAVVLSGEGADEIFGGYCRYAMLDRIQQIRLEPDLAEYQALLDHTVGDDTEVLVRMVDRSSGRQRAYLEQLVKDVSGASSLPERAVQFDWHVTFPVLVRMLDRMAGAHSLESRSPFLDVSVLEAGFRLPWTWKRGRKDALRLFARCAGVPDAVVDQRGKRGLSIPWNAWHGLSPTGSRGAWDRRHFALAMRSAWRRAYHLRDTKN